MNKRSLARRSYISEASLSNDEFVAPEELPKSYRVLTADQLKTLTTNRTRNRSAGKVISLTERKGRLVREVIREYEPA